MNRSSVRFRPAAPNPALGEPGLVRVHGCRVRGSGTRGLSFRGDADFADDSRWRLCARWRCRVGEDVGEVGRRWARVSGSGLGQCGVGSRARPGRALSWMISCLQLRGAGGRRWRRPWCRSRMPGSSARARLPWPGSGRRGLGLGLVVVVSVVVLVLGAGDGGGDQVGVVGVNSGRGRAGRRCRPGRLGCGGRCRRGCRSGCGRSRCSSGRCGCGRWRRCRCSVSRSRGI